MLTQTLPVTKTETMPNMVTLVRELPADLDTPVSVYLRLMGNGPSFLLESVTGGEQVARYSFIGAHPSQAFVLRGRTLETHAADGEITTHAIPPSQDPLDALRTELSNYQLQPIPGLPRFTGGLVGYLSYDLVRFFENTVSLSPHPDLPDAIFLHADMLVAFDHAFGRLLLIANQRISKPVVSPSASDYQSPLSVKSAKPYAIQQNGNELEAIDEARAKAEAKLDKLERRIKTPIPVLPELPGPPPRTELSSNMTRQQYMDAVRIAKEHIAAGDIFQVVPSQCFSRETTASPFSIYRALRRLNPSPYMFTFDFADLAGDESFHLIGASPEMHVRLEGKMASLRPIAGTRPRGATPAEDTALEKELLADPKECAEHVMLIDLARNDLGRVCEYGTVHVPEQMIIERYSHVMHIVSHTEGKLRPKYDAFDLMRATFPAGTVSGAPKIRAMQIINNLETTPRGPYAGAVGYYSYDGTSDTCITIRTLVMRGQTISIQAGGGIVADSDPEREYEETVNKARALAEAVEIAEGE